jgi:hypothetical protein
MKESQIIDCQEVGPGFLRGRTGLIGLLYHQGFVRPPRDVARLLPLLLMEYRRRLGELRQQFSKLRLSWGRCMGSLKASLAGGNPRLLLGCLCWRRS